MAEQRGKFLRGVLGGQVFRVSNKKQLVSARPARGSVKQTKETIRASNTFGMASSLGLQIRNTLSDELSDAASGALTNRLNTQLIGILNACRDPATKLFEFEDGSFSRLTGFEFNEACLVDKQFAKKPLIDLLDGKLRVLIPKLKIPNQLRFPGASFKCSLNYLNSLFRLEDGKYAKVPDLHQLEITKDLPELPEQELLFSIPTGCLCILSMFPEYFFAGKRGWERVKNFYPGTICGALINPGPYKGDVRRTWLKGIVFPV